MRRLFSVLAVMAIMAALVAASTMPAFAGLAKGQNDTNKGSEQDFKGDASNDVCFDRGVCNPGKGNNGFGTGNN